MICRRIPVLSKAHIRLQKASGFQYRTERPDTRRFSLNPPDSSFQKMAAARPSSEFVIAACFINHLSARCRKGWQPNLTVKRWSLDYRSPDYRNSSKIVIDACRCSYPGRHDGVCDLGDAANLDFFTLNLLSRSLSKQRNNHERFT